MGGGIRNLNPGVRNLNTGSRPPAPKPVVPPTTPTPTPPAAVPATSAVTPPPAPVEQPKPVAPAATTPVNPPTPPAPAVPPPNVIPTARPGMGGVPTLGGNPQRPASLDRRPNPPPPRNMGSGPVAPRPNSGVPGGGPRPGFGGPPRPMEGTDGSSGREDEDGKKKAGVGGVIGRDSRHKGRQATGRARPSPDGRSVVIGTNGQVETIESQWGSRR